MEVSGEAEWLFWTKNNWNYDFYVTQAEFRSRSIIQSESGFKLFLFQPLYKHDNIRPKLVIKSFKMYP